MVFIISFGIILVLVSAALIASHCLSWQQAKVAQEDSESELRFAWRRCRRRLQASGMIGIIGLVVCCFPLVRDPVVVVVYVLALFLLVVWVMLLALGDAVETRMHYRRVQRQHWDAETKFARQLRARAAPETNGDEATS